MLRTTSTFLALAFCSLLGVFAARGAAPVCGDADDTGSVTVTDGVQTLRSAAGLSTSCEVARCDVDGSGSITVTDGVKVLRAAAGLPVNLACGSQARFIDNGDGTVTDTKTGLQWEKKTGTVGDRIDCEETQCPSPHDVNHTHTWCLANFRECANPGSADGTAFTQFLAVLNTPPCFADRCDWRLPTVNKEGDVAELETIIDTTVPGCGSGSPCIDPIFGPTVANINFLYWSATTKPDPPPEEAWTVDFFNGVVGADNASDEEKINVNYVRAVRTLP
jgi:hypothetical protein